MKNLLPLNGELFYEEKVFSAAESEVYVLRLLNEVDWQQKSIRLFGKELLQPRLTAWYGDPGISYTYSGLKSIAQGWLPILSDIKERVEAKTRLKFNSSLINLYRNENDSMGWHRDNEKELGNGPVIASLSFGANRKFQIRDHKTKKQKINLDLSTGSLLIMAGEMQHHWEHRIAKSKEACGPRVNITFRRIL